MKASAILRRRSHTLSRTLSSSEDKIMLDQTYLQLRNANPDLRNQLPSVADELLTRLVPR
jgi:hypothetical protein